MKSGPSLFDALVSFALLTVLGGPALVLVLAVMGWFS